MTPLENRPSSRIGARGAALFVHGLGGGTYEVQWLAEAVHERTGLTVRTMHLPGHETPSRRMPRSRHEDWVDAVARERTSLGAEAGPVHLVGFSTGATICLRVTQAHGATGKLVLLAPFVDIYRPPLLPVRPEALLGLFSGLSQVPRRGPPLRDRAVRGDVKRCLPFSSMNLDAARSAKALCETVMRELDSVRAPVLIVQGMRDTVVDPRGAVRIDARLRCEHRLVMLEDSDHLVGLDSERERVFTEVSDFLGMA